AGESTGFLYPFIDADERDPEPLLKDLAASAEAKAAESARLQEATLVATRDPLEKMAHAMAVRLAAGARLFTFGNGGSSTDAATVAALFSRPPSGRAVAARFLVGDSAVVTALGNDVGYELVFSRQLEAYGDSGDVALGLSTSGNSLNLMTAFKWAHREGMLTTGLAGYDGGQMAASSDVDHCLVVGSQSIHRIQETQARLSFELWSRIQELLAA
ncbi:MAG: D-sedoheptulose-7-phosphate isomerase, partial [Acidimicrobiales bacterium]